ncbi:LysM peptidoglycan-binding domain-containing protein [Terrilactibacillus sp. S3-3]|nr:LysM peptidoglycan-binding domain-containing protein [Terrilactibacillus sp. S3-3]
MNNQETEKTEAAEEEPKSKREENALYLTKVLAGSEEEQFSKMRICIVQTGDSLQAISERYKVSISSLLRRNQLESERVDEGQVLYIPKSGKGKKDD